MVFAEISSERAFFRLPALNVLGIPPFHAEVVELVDTLGSGSSEGSFMGVRVSPSHHKKASGLTEQSVGPFLLRGILLVLGQKNLVASIESK